jgi:tetratricopeptide (TPR) repeat protein
MVRLGGVIGTVSEVGQALPPAYCSPLVAPAILSRLNFAEAPPALLLPVPPLSNAGVRESVQRFMFKAACLLFPLGLALAQPAGERPVALLKGMGPWRHPIATRNAEAQKYFDQGLALLYGFNRYEALRSFRKVAELDPQAIMGYWGMAMAQGPYINMDGDASYDLKAACAAIEAGRKVAGPPSQEMEYLDAVATWCPEYRPPAYIDAMRALSGRYPDDLDALTLYADSLMIPTRWHWYGADGQPAAGMSEAERALEEVMRRWPQHPGANHLYIHAVESSLAPERAIPSAQRLMGIVPGAGHMVHMPGHIWLVTGDWEAAAAVNERAAAVDREYFSATNVTGGTYTPYYLHNLDFIRYARSMQGRKGDAFRAAEALEAANAPMAQVMPAMADAVYPAVLFTHLRFQDWDYVMRLPKPDEKRKLGVAIWHYARAVAQVARGDRAAAEIEKEAFERARAAVWVDQPWGQNKAGDVLALASQTLLARFRSGLVAARLWTDAVTMQDALTYDEPPAWYYPLRESEGAASLRAGQAATAEEIFREGIKRSPHNGRMLFGLLESLKAQNKKEAADAVRREFEAAWAKADVQLRVEDL